VHVSFAGFETDGLLRVVLGFIVVLSNILEMSLKKEESKSADVPDVVFDPTTQKRYMKGRFLGKVCTKWQTDAIKRCDY